MSSSRPHPWQQDSSSTVVASPQPEEPPERPLRIRQYFVDASVRSRDRDNMDFGGAAWCTWETGQWVGRGIALGNAWAHRDELSLQAEIMAIDFFLDEALTKAYQLDVFVVYSDCTFAMYDVDAQKRGQYRGPHYRLLKDIGEKIEELEDRGKSVVFKYIPGHLPPSPNNYQAFGNHAADEMAKIACRASMHGKTEFKGWEKSLIIYANDGWMIPEERAGQLASTAVWDRNWG